jgi:hypothetical protein
LYWVTTSKVLKAISRAAWAAGVTDVGLQGGVLMGAAVIASDGADEGTLTLLDASQIAVAVADPPLELRTSSQTSIQLSDSPSQDSGVPVASTRVSAFQANLQVLICERNFSIKAIGPNAAVTVTGIGPAVATLRRVCKGRTDGKRKDNDDAMTLARGLATITANMRFGLAEAGDVQRSLALIVATFERCRHQGRAIGQLQAEIAQLKRLRVAS